MTKNKYILSLSACGASIWILWKKRVECKLGQVRKGSGVKFATRVCVLVRWVMELKAKPPGRVVMSGRFLYFFTGRQMWV